MPTLSGRPQDQPRHEYVYFEFYEGGGKPAVVTDQYKAVRLNWNAQPDGPLELYDLHADLGEERDLAGARPEVVKAMQQQMAEAHTTHTGSTLPPESFSGAKRKQAK